MFTLTARRNWRRVAGIAIIGLAAYTAEAKTATPPPQPRPVPIGSYYGAWNAATAYSTGSVVTYNGQTWLSVTARNKGGEPGTSSAWQVLGSAVAGPTGPQGPPGAEGVGSVKVYDAGNQFIGYLLGLDMPHCTSDPNVQVFEPVKKLVLPIHIDDAAGIAIVGDDCWSASWTTETYYLTTDCTGAAHYGLPYPAPLTTVFRMPGTGADYKYAVIEREDMVRGPMQSWKTQIREGCNKAESTGYFVPIPLTETAFPFTVPMPLPLRFEP